MIHFISYVFQNCCFNTCLGVSHVCYHGFAASLTFICCDSSGSKVCTLLCYILMTHHFVPVDLDQLTMNFHNRHIPSIQKNNYCNVLHALPLWTPVPVRSPSLNNGTSPCSFSTLFWWTWQTTLSSWSLNFAWSEWWPTLATRPVSRVTGDERSQVKCRSSYKKFSAAR